MELGMFNLLVKYSAWAEGRDTLLASRIFEQTDKALIDRFSTNGQPDFAALLALPSLFVEETSGHGDKIARIGKITRVGRSGRDFALEYNYDGGISGIKNSVLQEIAPELNINDYELSRTHWAVKDADIYLALLRNLQPRRAQPRVFQLPEHENIEPSLISVMMPFDARFDAVYAALRQTAEAVGLRCQRADDIWENPVVIQDVVSLIDRSRVVICDCTGRNPNVFYEVGIAHTLGREVILITQAHADIPFDLRHLRYVHYLDNGEGLAALCDRLQTRLSDLVA
jgi:hypothetical protein